jgi:hypothetical protein
VEGEHGEINEKEKEKWRKRKKNGELMTNKRKRKGRKSDWRGKKE